MMWRRPKITAHIFGELRKGIPHPPQSREDGNSEQTRARTTTENDKDYIKVCVLFLSV